MDQKCSENSPSSRLEDSKGDTFNQLRDVLPANRSSLTSPKDKSVKLNYASELIFNEKKLLVSGRKATQFQDCGISDLSGNSPLDEEPRSQLIAPCFAKKRRLRTELETLHHDESFNEHLSIAKDCQLNESTASNNYMECENSQGSNNGSAQVGAALHRKGSWTIEKRDIENLDQKDKVVQSGIMHSADDEYRGSEFLSQVRSFSIMYTFILGLITNKSCLGRKMTQGYFKINAAQQIQNTFLFPERRPYALLYAHRNYFSNSFCSLHSVSSQ